MLTLGTGIGSALFVDGRLVPNTELGHLQFHGKDAEKLLSATARERRELSWKRWAKDFNEYLAQRRALLRARPHHPRRRRQQGLRQVHEPI